MGRLGSARVWLAFFLVPAVTASCETEPAPSAIDAVIAEPPPGLGVQLDRVRLVIERVSGDGRFVDRPTSHRGPTIAPVAIRVEPESAGDPGRQLYRLSAQGYAADTLIVEQRHRVVFVPERTITLPFRLEASCVDVRCASDQTCVAGVCVDDFVPPCTLQGAEDAAFCRTDAGLVPPRDASTMDAATMRDAALPDLMPPEPHDSGLDANEPPDASDASSGCGCMIDGLCLAYEERNPRNQCEMCDPFTSPDAWVIATGYPCDDGLWCYVGERCDAAGACVTTPDRLCFDGNGCTEDVCNETTDACEYPPAEGSCSAGGSPGRCCRAMCIPVASPCI